MNVEYHAALASVPSSVYKLRRMLGIREFTHYVVCRKCNYVYDFSQCKDRNNRSKTCNFVAFPNHSQARMREHCGASLLKTVELASNKRILYLISHTVTLVLRHHFNLCCFDHRLLLRVMNGDQGRMSYIRWKCVE